MIDETLIFLAILGEADAATLTAVAAPLPEGWQNTAGVMVANGRFFLEPDDAYELLGQLNESDPDHYRRLNEQVYAELVRQMRAGKHENETAWTAVFERLANLYFAGDTPALLSLVQQAADLPLSSQSARQLRRYFQGVAAFRQDNYESAIHHFDELLAQADLPRHLRARTLNAQAVVFRVVGQLEAAMTGYQSSLALWQELGDVHYQGIVNLNLGIIAYSLRRYPVADEHLRRAEQLFHQAGSAVWARKVQSELGLVQRDLGQWDPALAYFDAYVAQSRQAGAEEDVGIGEANRGEVLLFKGDLAGARQALHVALRLLISRTYRVDHLLYLGLVHQAEGDLAVAEELYQQALTLALEINRREILPHVQYHLADVLRRQGEAEAALAHFIQAASLIEASSTPLRDETLKISLLGRWQQVYEALILHCLALGRVDEALTWTERARARAFADSFAEAEQAQMAATAAEIQATLPQGTTLLSYFTTGVLEQDMPLLAAIPADNPLREHILLPARTVCFLVNREGITVRDCPLNPNLFATQSPRGFDVTRFLKTAVCHRLFQDLLNSERAGSRLIIVPHGPLHRVPFTALFPESKRPLLAFAPSGTIFARLQGATVTEGAGCLAVGYNGDVGHGRFLRYSEAEVREVGSLLGGTVWNGRAPKKEQLRQAAAECRWLHIACHGWFNDADPLASYLQTGAEEVLTAREVLQTWRLKARLVTLSACESGLSQILRGDEPMGLVRAFLSVGARAVLVSQWRVDDLATFLLMRRFYELVGSQAMLDLSAVLHRAQDWLRQLTTSEAQAVLAEANAIIPTEWSEFAADHQPFADPMFWAGFILVGQ